MNFNIYLDTALGLALKRLAKRSKKSRNALIREAVEDLVAKKERSQGWSTTVLEWKGDPEFQSFDSHRTELREPVPDPLGDLQA